jgi:dolichol-phosphate mannosyltransferase
VTTEPVNAPEPVPAPEPGPAPELSIVIPVYNEGEAVEPVLRSLGDFVKTPCEILVVWDFDGDTTKPVVERLVAEIPGLRGVRNDLGRGVLNAMRAGIAESRGEFILISMADGSDEPHLIDQMVALGRGGADVVAGSRYMRGGGQLGGPPLKRLMSRTAGLTLHWFGGIPTHDATNNFKLYSRRFLESVRIQSEGGFELAIELTVKATLAGRRVAELPTIWRDRTAGSSNFKLRAWLPRYLRWYMVAMRGRLLRFVGRGAPTV